MKLVSPAFENKQPMPDIYSHKSGDQSPPLTISDVPETTISLALTVHDPDAPSGDFTHWLFWNSSPDSTVISQNEVPLYAIEGQNDAGTNHWFGPAPPSGKHRYVFTVFALDTLLNQPLSTSRYELEDAMKDHIIDKAQLTGTYSV